MSKRTIPKGEGYKPEIFGPHEFKTQFDSWDPVEKWQLFRELAYDNIPANVLQGYQRTSHIYSGLTQSSIGGKGLDAIANMFFAMDNMVRLNTYDYHAISVPGNESSESIARSEVASSPRAKSEEYHNLRAIRPAFPSVFKDGDSYEALLDVMIGAISGFGTTLEGFGQEGRKEILKRVLGPNSNVEQRMDEAMWDEKLPASTPEQALFYRTLQLQLNRTFWLHDARIKDLYERTISVNSHGKREEFAGEIIWRAAHAIEDMQHYKNAIMGYLAKDTGVDKSWIDAAGIEAMIDKRINYVLDRTATVVGNDLIELHKQVKDGKRIQNDMYKVGSKHDVWIEYEPREVGFWAVQKVFDGYGERLTDGHLNYAARTHLGKKTFTARTLKNIYTAAGGRL